MAKEEKIIGTFYMINPGPFDDAPNNQPATIVMCDKAAAAPGKLLLRTRRWMDGFGRGRTEEQHSRSLARVSQTQTQGRAARESARRLRAGPRARHGIILIGRRWSGDGAPGGWRWWQLRWWWWWRCWGWSSSCVESTGQRVQESINHCGGQRGPKTIVSQEDSDRITRAKQWWSGVD